MVCLSVMLLQNYMLMTELSASDFVIKDFVVKKEHYLCRNVCVCVSVYVC